MRPFSTKAATRRRRFAGGRSRWHLRARCSEWAGGTGVACTQRLEIVAPDGTSCGATDYVIASGTCDTFEMRLAADGTVIQELPSAMETFYDSIGQSTCTWRWWPGAAQ